MDGPTKTVTSETVIKCSFSLKHQQVREHIEKLVQEGSKFTFKLGCVFNQMILYCLENNIDLPNFKKDSTYLHCGKVSHSKSKSKIDPIIQLVYDSQFENIELPYNEITGQYQRFPYLTRHKVQSF